MEQIKSSGRLMSTDPIMESFFNDSSKQLRLDYFKNKMSKIVDETIEKVGKDCDKEVVWIDLKERSKKELSKIFQWDEEIKTKIEPLLVASVSFLFNKALGVI